MKPVRGSQQELWLESGNLNEIIEGLTELLIFGTEKMLQVLSLR